MRRRLPPSWGLSALAAACLLVLVVWPLAELISRSLQVNGHFSLGNLASVLGDRAMLDSLLNSLLLGLACACLSVLVGAPLAWLVSQTDLPLRGLVRLSVLAAFVTPGFVNALSWILLAGPNAGLLNQAWMALTGASHGLFNIYSLAGVTVVSFTTIYPLAFLLVFNAMQSIDSEVEEAARVSGAGHLHVLCTITLPLVRPALIGGFILTFLEAIVLYGAPAVIGQPARLYVATTQLAMLFTYPPQIGRAAALSLVLLVVICGLLLLQRSVLSGRSYATIRGKGGRRRRIRLGAWRWPALASAFVVLLATVYLPYCVIIETAFLAQSYRGFSLGNLTLANFADALGRTANGTLAIRNSLITGGMAATAAVLVAGLVAYLVARRLAPWRGLLSFLAMAPAVIPGMVLAVGLLAAYGSPPVMLYGTLWILAVAYLTKFLPFAYMTCVSAIANVYEDLESAARILGAGRVRVMRDITGPLIRQSLLAAWILVFVPSLKDLSASILLFNSRTTVIATSIMDAYYLPSWETVAALSTILLLINAAVIGIGTWAFGANTLGGSN